MHRFAANSPTNPIASMATPYPLGKGGTFMGQHILVPKEGVAVHINAFNFPVWGMLEKIAVNLLAGVPAVVKPATINVVPYRSSGAGNYCLRHFTRRLFTTDMRLCR